jgi:hypothetical protein
MLDHLITCVRKNVRVFLLALGMTAINANAAHLTEDLELIVSRNANDSLDIDIALARVPSNRDQHKRVSSLVEDKIVPVLGYPSIEETVIAAANRYNPRSVKKDREQVGAVLRDDHGHYYYTHAEGGVGKDTIRFSVPLPKCYDLVAFWHTHGSKKPERKYFSDVDTQIANKLKRPIYLGDPGGNLRVFNPGDSVFRSTVRVPRGRGARVPRGSAEGALVKDGSGQKILIRTS